MLTQIDMTQNFSFTNTYLFKGFHSNMSVRDNVAYISQHSKKTNFLPLLCYEIRRIQRSAPYDPLPDLHSRASPPETHFHFGNKIFAYSRDVIKMGSGLDIFDIHTGDLIKRLPFGEDFVDVLFSMDQKAGILHAMGSYISAPIFPGLGLNRSERKRENIYFKIDLNNNRMMQIVRLSRHLCNFTITQHCTK